jgi:pimeloyl-ACP methyl ester carboxylesterase
MTKPFQRGRFDDLPEKPRRPHRYFESRGAEVRVESAHFGPVAVHYREVGQGPPLLLVHGLMTTSYSWRYVLDELGREFRVIAPDLPGCGRSDKPSVRYSGPQLAQLVLDFQQALGIRGCLTVGNSMGGYLCMRAAQLDPGAFSRLVNIHSPGPSGARYVALHTALSLPPLRALLSWWVRRAPRKWAHRNVHYFDESLKSLEEAGEYGDPLATEEGAGAFIRYLWHTFDPAELRQFMRDLQPLAMPLLLLYSRQDPLVPPSVGPQLQSKTGAELQWLEDTSHFAHVDTPEKVLAVMRPFLTGRSKDQEGNQVSVPGHS